MHLVTALWRFLAFKSFNAHSRRRASGKAFVADKFDIYVRTCARAHNARARVRAINLTCTNKHVASKNAKKNNVTTKGG